ncbi:GGDEF domain-containing protein [Vibrio methylphosphonaticus]|uniref:GGDEF domain-containing protein n=1 Tax=Vibrio methylphosphonaticus TaxID=2946866 RepID=UPI00202A4D3D|nr:GGDEF domain-containing protein [Vibrio methylphosphonaticus]MCL9775013.1 GGDEF domain-containing protein [Vibrio methylphosphonaticus]
MTFIFVIILSPSVFANGDDESKTYLVSAHSRDFLARFIFSTIEEQTDLHFDYVDYPSFSQRLDAIEHGNVDFVANITFIESRANRFSFSSPINIEPTYVFSLDGRAFDELNIIGNTMGTAFTDIIQKYYPDKRVLDFSDNQVAFDAISSGYIDGYIGTFLQLEDFLNAGFKPQLINDKVTIPPVSIVTNKPQNMALLSRFSEIMSQENVQKKMRKTVEDYITSIAIEQLQQKLSNSNFDLTTPVSIYLNPRQPYVFSDKQGQPTGISVDFAKEVCELNGLRCQFLYQPEEPWKTTFLKLKLGDRDVTTPIASSKNRTNIAYFSHPYAFIDGVIAKRIGFKQEVYKHISELFAESIGVVEDDIFAEVTERLLPNKALTYYPDTQSMMKGLINNEINYAVTNHVTLNKLLFDENISNVIEDKYFRPFYRSELGFAFPKTERGETLSQLFNRTLDFIDSDAINKRYLPPANWRELHEKEQERQRLDVIIGLLVLLVLVCVFFWFVTHHRANRDALTKLKNRHALNRIRKQTLGKGNYLIYIDLNKFKHINDTYGHNVGDHVLRCYTKRLNQTMKGDIYRIGGDEFVIISHLSGKRLDDILLRLTSFDFVLRGKNITLSLSASVGVFLPDTSSLSIKQLLIYTDFAMYEAKNDATKRSVVVDKQKLNELIAIHEPMLRSRRTPTPPPTQDANASQHS